MNYKPQHDISSVVRSSYIPARAAPQPPFLSCQIPAALASSYIRFQLHSLPATFASPTLAPSTFALPCFSAHIPQATKGPTLHPSRPTSQQTPFNPAMRFSTVFTLAFAALACAQELPLSPRADKHHVEKAHEKAAHEKAAAKAAAAKAAAAKHHSEEEARKHKATSTVATSTHSASGGVSTKCAAIARRSSRYEVDLDDISIAKRDTTCQVTGYLTDPSETTVEYNVAQQRCANTCTCRDDGKCKTFTFTAERTVDGVARGQCTMYTETLSNMGFTAGTDPSTGSSSSKSFMPLAIAYSKLISNSLYLSLMLPQGRAGPLQWSSDFACRQSDGPALHQQAVCRCRCRSERALATRGEHEHRRGPHTCDGATVNITSDEKEGGHSIIGPHVFPRVLMHPRTVGIIGHWGNRRCLRVTRVSYAGRTSVETRFPTFTFPWSNHPHYELSSRV